MRKIKAVDERDRFQKKTEFLFMRISEYHKKKWVAMAKKKSISLAALVHNRMEEE